MVAPTVAPAGTGCRASALASGVLAIVLTAVACAGPVLARDLAIVDARILPAPDAPVVDNGTVLVRDGRIVAVGRDGEVGLPDGVEVIDADGRTLLAGFWNSHVHFLAPPMMQAGTQPAAQLSARMRGMLTQWGFTTVFDLGSLGDNTRALQQRIATGEVDGPLILSVHAPFFPAGGTPSYVSDLLQRIGAPSFEVADAEAASARARRQVEAGADGVKLFIGAIIEGGTGVLHMDAGVARAAASPAESAGKPVFAHPTDARGVDLALQAGVDVLSHTTPAAGPWPADVVARLVDGDVALVPSLMLFEVELAKEGAPAEVGRRFIATAGQQARALHDAGGTLLFGTDVGYIEPVDPTREYRLLADAGLDWRAVLRSLTTAPARTFGYGDSKGRVAVGFDADLVLLDRDPRDDTEAFADVAMTLRDGRVIHDATQ